MEDGIKKAISLGKIESDIQNEIRIWCGEHDIVVERINVGKGYTPDGRFFTTGVSNGFPDLLLILNNGRVFFCECKQAKGRAREDQLKYHAMLKRRGQVILMPHSLEEFVKEMEKLL